MRTVARGKWMLMPMLVLCLAAETCLALDVNTVLTMKKNGVAEETILHHVRQAGGVPTTLEQANSLRAAGASEQLIVAMNISYPPQTGTTSTAQPATVAASPQAMRSSSPRRVVDAAVTPVSITTIGSRPALCEKEGWLTISNSDVHRYHLLYTPRNSRLFLSKTPNGGIEIPSGYEITINIRKETYKLYGESGNALSIKIREGEPTRLALVPFGSINNSGLTGTAQDRERIRSEVLFGNYVPPPTVIVPAPVVVTQPAPVVVVPGPPAYYHPRRYYYGYGW